MPPPRGPPHLHLLADTGGDETVVRTEADGTDLKETGARKKGGIRRVVGGAIKLAVGVRVDRSLDSLRFSLSRTQGARVSLLVRASSVSATPPPKKTKKSRRRHRCVRLIDDFKISCSTNQMLPMLNTVTR